MTGRDNKLQGIRSLHIVLLLFPCWLLLYYFKSQVAHWLVFGVLGQASAGSFSKAASFFVLTCIKIFLLLILIVFILALIRSWISHHKIKKRIRSVSPFTGTVLGGLFGIAVPYCSCSAVPMFIGFLETGIPLGVTFSFLIASPLVNEVILIMLFSLFGLKIALVYLLAGLVIAITAGYIIGKLGLESSLPAWLLNYRHERQPSEINPDINTRIQNSLKAVKEILSRTWIYITAGILTGAVIHGYLPETWISTIAGENRWYTMPLVVLTGIPLYSCSASVAPVAFALVDKGMPLGTTLAFTMAVAALSLPEFIMLRKVLTTRLLLIFAGILFTGILLVGYLFNFIF